MLYKSKLMFITLMLSISISKTMQAIHVEDGDITYQCLTVIVIPCSNWQERVQSHGPGSESIIIYEKAETEPELNKYHVNEFKDIYDQGFPPKGFYVVAGTFLFLNNAKAETQLYVLKGNITNWIYVGPDDLNYIFLYKCETKEQALEKLKTANKRDFKDAWLLELID